MSVRAMAAVWASGLPGPEKFLALALADFADDQGDRVYPSIDTLARMVGVGRSAVQRNLRRLESREVLVLVERGGGRSANRWRLDLAALPPAANRHPPQIATGSPQAAAPAASTRQEPPGTHPSGDQNATRPDHRRAQLPIVDRKRATPADWSLAAAILVAWNDATGQTLTADDWLSMFVRRIRFDRERAKRLGTDPLDAGGHAALIAALIAAPWWKGRPSPNLAYGNDRAFEQARDAAENTVRDRRRLGSEWDADAIVRRARERYDLDDEGNPR